MSNHIAVADDCVATAVQALGSTGGHLIPAADFSRLVRADPADWARFGRQWDDLEIDTYMADGGTYRYRRYGQYELESDSGELTLLPHEPYRQERSVNALNGGVDRLFEPLTSAFTGDPLLHRVLTAVGGIFTAVEGVRRWNVKLHPYRILAGEELGQPAPEGLHRDGVTFITSLLISRVNVLGGESSTFTNEGEHLITTTLSDPGDLLLGDDRRTMHSVTPIRPQREGARAHRDVLVMAYTAR